MSEATIIQADATRLPLADQSVDLVMGSPPYCEARTYGRDDVARDAFEWVDWMLEVTTEALRVSRGPVVWVAAGVTRDRNYWPACEGLMWEWYKRGGSMYRPCYWHRVGIPGSGGDQWFRADVEYVMCFKRPGPLPWSDNTAMGHPCKHPVGGAVSYRTPCGRRRNARTGSRLMTKRRDTGPMEVQNYSHPEKANPGNLIHVKVGGGHLGDRLAHENEAPYPEKLAEFFIRSLCPPGGTVLDPFSGSGTTAKVAVALGRNAIACDLRGSQCELTRRRLGQVQMQLV